MAAAVTSRAHCTHRASCVIPLSPTQPPYTPQPIPPPQHQPDVPETKMRMDTDLTYAEEELTLRKANQCSLF